MKDFDALKDIWSNQVGLPKISPEDILKRTRRTKKQFANRLLFEVLTMVAAIILLSATLYTMDFKMWTSHMAILIFIGCCFYVMFAQLRAYRKIQDTSLLMSKPREYIEYLKSYKKERYVLNTRKYRIYSLFFIVGLMFFFIEIFFIAPTLLTILGVTFTAVWLFICYKVFMKTYIRKEEGRLNEMIENLHRLQQQFTGEKAL